MIRNIPMQGFNYCRCAKLLIAIPAYPLIALTAASFFTTTAFQVIAGVGAMLLAYKIVVWLDRLPLFIRKITTVKDS